MPNGPDAPVFDANLALNSINTIRFLAVDAVQKANSGHPGMPMGAAPMAYVTWQNHLSIDPSAPSWSNRDRFVLSAGHGSMLIYSLLHLTGFDLSIEDLKNFRQLGSKTPGHPENFHTAGIETTTGPLGQGFANGVGMAIAESHLAATFNRPGFDVVNHFTYAIVSDGDLMEGISHEAASLAGHLKLGKLIYLYDDNKISIDGSTELSFTEDVTGRFRAYGWQVLDVKDGNDIAGIHAAIEAGKAESGKPTIIRVRTVIGYGSPNKGGTASSHGSPLGEAEIKLTKDALGWPQEPTFLVPAEVKSHMGSIATRGAEKRNAWDRMMLDYKDKHPDLASSWNQWSLRQLPANLVDILPAFEAGSSVATRAASGKVLAAISKDVPFLIGGSADLTGSNLTNIPGRKDYQASSPEGGYFFFGVREHAMASICNGMELHGGLRSYNGTFLVFSDYMRPAIRLSALMGLGVTYVLTHDSIGLGEDGPTHQPIEHFMALRAIPNCSFFRPADGPETAAAWVCALENTKGPSLLALSRQNLPTMNADVRKVVEMVKKGAYVVRKAKGKAAALIMATGSEVEIAVKAAEMLVATGVEASVVSMPCWENFEAQDRAYRESVLPTDVDVRVSIEAGITFGWERYLGPKGISIGINSFGASGPAPELFNHFGLTPEKVVAAVKSQL
ncbi:MAG: transketolase [Bacteroidetes bacterium]|nr:transketolase [Bacteroidota bacterium]